MLALLLGDHRMPAARQIRAFAANIRGWHAKAAAPLPHSKSAIR